ncbi:UDP-galactopyranose mutase [Salinispora arenicola]|uniref:UDP-galactopyranose mutase n=1 Tax=Salinispora arenicola TaxID=168697 RepID=UPI00037958F6|nr:UDP-galactopyranose mutase [Salinispora arenicola]
MNVDLVVVGAGLFGLTVAERCAGRLGMRVLVVEARRHIGGNAYSELEPETGIEVHRYGAHLFHTSNESVWAYANRFTRFTDYVHRVYTRHGDEIFPLPINLATINQFTRSAMSPSEAAAWVRDRAAQYRDGDVSNLERKAISLIGRDLYEAFVREYTAKQWEADPMDLPATVIARLPVRYTYDNRYFSDTHEGLPVDGYTRWFERMIDSDRVEILLGNDFLDRRSAVNKHNTVGRVEVVYTGPLDRYFDRVAGGLTWRTLDFAWEVVPTGDYQGTAVINYADRSIPYLRTIEFRHFHPERDHPRDRSVIAREYSRLARPEDEPYYPVNSTMDRHTLHRYRNLARQETGVHFGGRLGTYRYLDMHMAIASALRVVDRLAARRTV